MVIISYKEYKGEIVPIDYSNQITEDQLKDVIHRALSSGGSVIWSMHFKESINKRGYDSQDVNYILRFGKLIKSEFSQEHNNWAYRLKGITVDGSQGAVVTVIVSERVIRMITALGNV